MFFRGLCCVLLFNSALGDCTRELTAVLSRFFTLAPTDTPSAMAAASGKWLNDLGDYSACTRIAEAEYALLYVKIEGLFIGVGLCGPKNCSADDYYGILDQLQSLHSIAPFTEAAQIYAALPSATLPAKLAQPEVQIVFPRTLEPDGLTFGAGLMVGCCVLLVACVVAGTILEAFYIPPKQAVPKLQKNSIELTEIKESYSNPYQKLATEHAKVSDPSMLVQSLLSFSLMSNLPRLFSVSEKDRSNPLFVLNGVRVLSMLWIVLGHVLAFGLAGVPTKNPEAILPYFKQLRGTLLFIAHFAVDTFLWLTGFLLAFILLQKIAVRGDVPKVWQLYLHRVVRILPTLAFTLFLSWTIAAYSARGPLAFSMQDINKSCEQYWWTNLFFVNNEYPDGLGNGCFGQTWYLAVDMQLYFAAVPLVLLYHSKRSYGWFAGALLCLISVVSSACIIWTYEFAASPLAQGNLINNQFGRLYVQPYTRATPLVLGLFCAFILHSAKLHKSASQVYDSFALRLASLFDFRCVRRICFVASCSMVLYLIAMQDDAMQGIDNKDALWSRGENTFFMSTSRLIWSVSLSLFLLPLLLGLSPIYRWVLSWPLWAPLAKLSFCVYLVHLHVIFAYRYSSDTVRWFGDLNLYTDFCFVTVVSFVVSAFIYLSVELPAQSLARVILKIT